jgi:hypothetical protein
MHAGRSLHESLSRSSLRPLDPSDGGMMKRTFRHAGRQYYTCGGCGKHYCTQLRAATPICNCGIGSTPHPEGLVGSALKSIIAAWGFQPCRSCRRYAAKLDRAGPDWCEKNKAGIVERLMMQTKKRLWWTPPGTQWTLSRIVDVAIRKARKNET